MQYFWFFVRLGGRRLLPPEHSGSFAIRPEDSGPFAKAVGQLALLQGIGWGDGLIPPKSGCL